MPLLSNLQQTLGSILIGTLCFLALVLGIHLVLLGFGDSWRIDANCLPVNDLSAIYSRLSDTG